MPWIVTIGVLLCVVSGFLWICHLVSYQYNGSALHRAARYGDLKAVQWHLSLGADINDQAKRAMIGRKTPLQLAIENGHDDIALYLLAHGANPNLADRQGRTPLYIAIQHPVDTGLIHQLLEKNANPNSWDDGGETPLHLAAKAGNSAYIALLLSHGAHADDSDKSGGTPLLYAIQAGSDIAVSTLVAAGVDIFRSYSGDEHGLEGRRSAAEPR